MHAVICSSSSHWIILILREGCGYEVPFKLRLVGSQSNMNREAKEVSESKCSEARDSFQFTEPHVMFHSVCMQTLGKILEILAEHRFEVLFG